MEVLAPNIKSKEITNVPSNLKTLPASVSSELLRRNLNESRRAFLENDLKKDNSDTEKRKPRKISFKIKNSSNRKVITSKQTITISKVQQLANKYNELVYEDQKKLKEQKRATKKTENKNVRRKNSFKRLNNDKIFVRAKISYLESPKLVQKSDSVVKKTSVKTSNGSVKKQPSFHRQKENSLVKKKLSFRENKTNSVSESLSQNDTQPFQSNISVKKQLSFRGSQNTNVKAAIEIFEKQTDVKIEKPKIPEKNVKLIVENGKIKIFGKNDLKSVDLIKKIEMDKNKNISHNENLRKNEPKRSSFQNSETKRNLEQILSKNEKFGQTKILTNFKKENSSLSTNNDIKTNFDHNLAKTNSIRLSKNLANLIKEDSRKEIEPRKDLKQIWENNLVRPKIGLFKSEVNNTYQKSVGSVAEQNETKIDFSKIVLKSTKPNILSAELVKQCEEQISSKNEFLSVLAKREQKNSTKTNVIPSPKETTELVTSYNKILKHKIEQNVNQEQNGNKGQEIVKEPNKTEDQNKIEMKKYRMSELQIYFEEKTKKIVPKINSYPQNQTKLLPNQTITNQSLEIKQPIEDQISPPTLTNEQLVPESKPNQQEIDPDISSGHILPQKSQNHQQNFETEIYDVPRQHNLKKTYDNILFPKTTVPNVLLSRSRENVANETVFRPNSSFLWRSKSKEVQNVITNITYEEQDFGETCENKENIYKDTGQNIESKKEESKNNLDFKVNNASSETTNIGLDLNLELKSKNIEAETYYKSPKKMSIGETVQSFLYKNDPNPEMKNSEEIPKSFLYQLEESNKEIQNSFLLQTTAVQKSFLHQSKISDTNISKVSDYEEVQKSIPYENDIVSQVHKYENNFEELYDTVDPPKIYITSSDTDFNNFTSKTDSLLDSTSSSLQVQNNEDSISNHSYESFECAYEEMNYDSIHSSRSSKIEENLYESLPSPKGDDIYESLPSPKSRSPNKNQIYESLPSKKSPQQDNIYYNKDLYESLASSKSISPSKQIYESLPKSSSSSDSNVYYNKDFYESLKSPKPGSPSNYDNEDLYEVLPSDIYESLPSKTYDKQIYWQKQVQNRELPPRPESSLKDENIYTSIKSENTSNCYESIYVDKKRFSLPTNQNSKNRFNRLSIDVNQFKQVKHMNKQNDIHISDMNHFKSETIDMNQFDDDFYESIGETIRRDDISSCGSNRDSIVSCDQSNSLYGRCTWNGAKSDYSDRSCSDRSDDWVDMSDDDRGDTELVIVRERQRNRKNAGWSGKVRDQWYKSPRKSTIEDDTSHDPSHLYESLPSVDSDDFDSFDSDSEDESFTKNQFQNDSGVDMGNCQLPEPPNSTNIYSLTQLAAKAGRHMKKLRRNWSLTKNDITKSLSRINIMKSTTNIHMDTQKEQKHRSKLNQNENSPNTQSSKSNQKKNKTNSQNGSNLNSPNTETSRLSAVEPKLTSPNKSPIYQKPNISSPIPTSDSKIYDSTDKTKLSSAKSFVLGPQNRNSFSYLSPSRHSEETSEEKRNSLGRKKNWLKFRRSASMVEPTQSHNLKTSSTFYLTDEIDVDAKEKNEQNIVQTPQVEETKPVAPVRRKPKTVAQRPQSPPPPLPTDKKNVKKSTRGTSWYAEVGLFPPTKQPVITPPPMANQGERTSTCWYAEIGLYPKQDTPSTSSGENSGNSGDNTRVLEISDSDASEILLRNQQNLDYDAVEVRNSNYINHIPQNRPQSLEKHLQTKDEQLYQFYNQSVIENACRSNSSSEDSDYDGYEEIGARLNVNDMQETPKKIRPISLFSADKKRSNYYSHRSLWCEIPEVQESLILNTLTAQEKKLQEAKFEIITSEVSYLKSLNVLESHFIAGFQKDDILSKEEFNCLFGKVRSVTECSQTLLSDLEHCWQENIMLLGICDIMLKHSKEYSQVYVCYCENQVFLDHTLKKLRERNKPFSETLKQLESSPSCQMLSLYSFLMLPMQRVTRLPLLVDAVLKRLTPDHCEYDTCQKALISLNQLVQECNEAARKIERTSETNRVLSQLEFPPTIPPLPIPAAGPNGTATRYLVRSGELTQLISRGEDSSKLTIGKRFGKIQIHLFLFEDILVIGKKKGEDKYGVIHHCPRNFVELDEDTLDKLPMKEAQGKHLLFLTLLENHNMKMVEMLLMCPSETDKQRWTEALTPPKSSNPDETLYEAWDCPQVTCIHFYTATQPDELSLVPGDVLNISRKTSEGWFYGTRCKDSHAGWFPGNHTKEIVNKHVRARNLKQRYRFILTASYLNKNNK